MNKVYDVVALGELLIDFSQKKDVHSDAPVYEANPGGAPCNVLAFLSKLNNKTAFIGKVGKDNFGAQLKEVLEDLKINTDGLVFDDKVNTTLAFVHTDEQGERSFSFYRNPGADMNLKANEVNETHIKNAKIFHFGTLSMTHKGVEEATKKAIAIAKESGAIISFDPNLRPALWDSLSDARTAMKYGCSVCDIIKIEDEELKFMLECDTIEEGLEILKRDYNIKLINITKGKKGSLSVYGDMFVEKPAFLQEKTIDTTGAGDTFCGGVLGYVLKRGLDDLSEENLSEMLAFANAAASLITTKRGALCSMPAEKEILELIAERQ